MRDAKNPLEKSFAVSVSIPIQLQMALNKVAKKENITASKYIKKLIENISEVKEELEKIKKEYY